MHNCNFMAALIGASVHIKSSAIVLPFACFHIPSHNDVNKIEVTVEPHLLDALRKCSSVNMMKMFRHSSSSGSWESRTLASLILCYSKQESSEHRRTACKMCRSWLWTAWYISSWTKVQTKNKANELSCGATITGTMYLCRHRAFPRNIYI